MLSGSQIGAGTVQRSSVSSITVTFDRRVNFPANAFTLTRSLDGQNFTDVSAGITISNPSADGVTWVLNVTPGGSLDRTAATTVAGLFVDGIFQLVLHGANITDAATGTGHYNGGADQIIAYNSAEAGGPSNYFHVLYGDTNGDGSVNLTDYRQFKLDYLSSSADSNYDTAFDYDGDGGINLTDYRQFKLNYLNSFTY